MFITEAEFKLAKQTAHDLSLSLNALQRIALNIVLKNKNLVKENINKDSLDLSTTTATELLEQMCNLLVKQNRNYENLVNALIGKKP